MKLWTCKRVSTLYLFGFSITSEHINGFVDQNHWNFVTSTSHCWSDQNNHVEQDLLKILNKKPPNAENTIKSLPKIWNHIGTVWNNNAEASVKACIAEASCNLFCNSSVSFLFFSTSSYQDIANQLVAVDRDKATKKYIQQHVFLQIFKSSTTHLNPKQLKTKTHDTKIHNRNNIQHRFHPHSHDCPWPVMSQFLAVSFPILRFSVSAAPFLPSSFQC